MISDCGNDINSVKFKVWLNDDNSGVVEVAHHSEHRPKGTTGDDWKRKFHNCDSLLYAMATLKRKVRAYDCMQEDRVYCPTCNTVTIIKNRHSPYIGTKVKQCGYCGSHGPLHPVD